MIPNGILFMEVLNKILFRFPNLPNALHKATADELQKLAPGYQFCSTFQDLIRRGAGNKQFKNFHNKNWDKHTRIFLEAFFHAKYFLEMAVKYGKELKNAPSNMPSGWAALLSLFVKKSLDRI